MQDFTYSAWPARVLFGPGRLSEAGAELERLGIARALVLTTPEQAEDGKALAERIGRRPQGRAHGGRCFAV